MFDWNRILTGYDFAAINRAGYARAFKVRPTYNEHSGDWGLFDLPAAEAARKTLNIGLLMIDGKIDPKTTFATRPGTGRAAVEQSPYLIGDILPDGSIYMGPGKPTVPPHPGKPSAAFAPEPQPPHGRAATPDASQPPEEKVKVFTELPDLSHIPRPLSETFTEATDKIRRAPEQTGQVLKDLSEIEELFRRLQVGQDPRIGVDPAVVKVAEAQDLVRHLDTVLELVDTLDHVKSVGGRAAVKAAIRSTITQVQQALR